jgi:hypothetical protein
MKFCEKKSINYLFKLELSFALSESLINFLFLLTLLTTNTKIYKILYFSHNLSLL